MLGKIHQQGLWYIPARVVDHILELLQARFLADS